MRPFDNPAVRLAFDGFPPPVRERMLQLRQLIFDTAASTPGVGALEETLKWGEPAYLTSQSKSGSTVRINWKKSRPSQYAVLFNCHTTLIETFRTLFPDDFTYEGNRAILFDKAGIVPIDALSFCIAAALTYHLPRRRSG
jgi:hypothetical protein